MPDDYLYYNRATIYIPMKNLLLAVLVIASNFLNAQKSTVKFGSYIKLFPRDFIGFTNKGTVLFNGEEKGNLKYVIYNDELKQIKTFEVPGTNGEEVRLDRIFNTKGHTYGLYTRFNKGEKKTLVYLQEVDAYAKPTGGAINLTTFDGSVFRDYWHNDKKGLFVSNDSAVFALVLDKGAPKGENRVKVLVYGVSGNKLTEKDVLLEKNETVNSVKVSNTGTVLLTTSETNYKNRHAKQTSLVHRVHVVNEDDKSIVCDFSDTDAPISVKAVDVIGDVLTVVTTVSKKGSYVYGISTTEINVKTGKAGKKNMQLLKPNGDTKDEFYNKEISVYQLQIRDVKRMSDGSLAILLGKSYVFDNFDLSYVGDLFLCWVPTGDEGKIYRLTGIEGEGTDAFLGADKLFEVSGKIYFMQLAKGDKYVISTLSESGSFKKEIITDAKPLAIQVIKQKAENQFFVMLRGSNAADYILGVITVAQ